MWYTKKRENTMHSYTEVQVGLKLWFFFLRKLRVLEFVFRACEINLLYLFNLFFETMRDQNARSSKKKKKKKMKNLTRSLGFCNCSLKGSGGESKHWHSCNEIANVGSALLYMAGGGVSVGRHLPQTNPCSSSLCFCRNWKGRCA